MPIVLIKTVVKLDDDSVERMIANVQREGAAALGSDLHNVWVRYELVCDKWYRQDSDRGYDSPILLIMAQKGRSDEMRTRFVESVVCEVAAGLSVEADKVWAYYQEMDPRDVWHNGSWSFR